MRLRTKRIVPNVWEKAGTLEGSVTQQTTYNCPPVDHLSSRLQTGSDLNLCPKLIKSLCPAELGQKGGGYAV